MNRALPPAPDDLPTRAIKFVESWVDQHGSVSKPSADLQLEEAQRQCPAESADIVMGELLRREIQLRIQSGETPTVGEYSRRFPQLTTVISDLFNALVETSAGGDLSDRPSGHEETAALFPVPSAADSVANPSQAASFRVGDTVGDYELIELLGRGGMGVVFKARQRSADRWVAWKCIRPEFLERIDAERRQRVLDRFRQEAQAAAGLQHEAVVTVFDVGDANGCPYYSMELVLGSSLAQLLIEGPLDSERAANYLRAVSRAISGAHQRQILHRDIKPANIMIQLRGDCPKIMDFGLAKLLEGSSQMTESHDVLGSPPYMAPEQASASSEVTAAADIYSLGATLYHCLTGRPPFQGATPAQTIHQLMQLEPVSPRQLNASVPADLETICLKCLDKDPRRRYGSANELAEELNRYLEGKPIVARPLGVAGRSIRWARRNPLVASLLATVAVSLTALVVILSIAVQMTTAALAESEQAREKELAAYRLSRQHFSLAQGAVQTFLRKVADDRRLKSKGMQPLRQDLLSEAARFFEELILVEGNDPTLRLDRARSRHGLSLITASIGSRAEALRQMEQATDETEQLVDQDPANAEFQFELISQLIDQAQIMDLNGDRDDAVELVDTAVEKARALVGRAADYDHRNQLGLALGAMGNLLTESLRLEDAAKTLAEAREVYTSLAEDYPDRVEPRMHETDCLINLYGLAYREGKLEEGDAYLLIVRDQLQPMLQQQDPLTLQDATQRLAAVHHNMGMSHEVKKEYDDARSNFQQAVLLFSELLQLHPLDQELRSHRSASALRLGQSYLRQQQVESAEASIHMALEDLQRLELRNQNDDLAVGIAQACNSLAVAAWRTSRSQEAINWLTSAIDRLAEREEPENANAVIMHDVMRCDSYATRAQVYEQLGDYQLAAADWERARDINELRQTRGAGFTTTCQMRVWMNRARSEQYATAVDEAVIWYDQQEPAGAIEYNMACILAAAADSASQDPLLAEDERKAARKSLVDNAWQALAAAEEGGTFENSMAVQAIRTEKMLDSLREDSRFIELLKRLESEK